MENKPQGLLHKLFDGVVILKGLNGLAEIISGTSLLFLRDGSIISLVTSLTQAELIEDPQDHLALLLQHWAAGFGNDSQQFAALYLLAHGVGKVLLAVMLFLEKTWAFPLALVLFSVLITFSIYRLTMNWSLALAGFVVFDLFTIWLIAREWMAIKRLSPVGEDSRMPR